MAATSVKADARLLNEQWIDLEVRLIGWSFGDFKLKTKASKPLSVLLQTLIQKHGKAEFHLFREHHAPENELTDIGATMTSLGFAYGPKHAAPVQRLLYDFKPFDAGNPVLLACKPRGCLGIDDGAL